MTQQYIDVIAAHMRGEKIEWRAKDGGFYWLSAGRPSWNFMDCEFRVAPEPKVPDSIDWSHVASQWNWLATDSSGDVWLYQNEPRAVDGGWRARGTVLQAENFSSYKRGTVNWTESLVERPQP